MTRNYLKCRKTAWLVTLHATLLATTGCRGAHVVNVVGSYFPFWLICMAVGVAAAFVSRIIFVRMKIEPYLGPLSLIYMAVIIGTSCLLWLVFS